MGIYSDIAIFVCVGETRSFTRAAHAMGLTPSAVSKAISRLEFRLSARLIERSTRSLRVTGLGAEYFDRCKDALEQIEQADSRISDASAKGSGRLRLEVPAAMGRHLVVPALAKFLANHSDIRLEVLLCERSTDLFRGDIDAAIRIGPLLPSDLVASRVGEMRRVVCGAPALIARYGEPMSPSELRPKQCLAVIDPQSARPTPWTFERYGTKECVEPDSAIILGDTDAAISAALHHFGYVQAPNLAVQHLLAAGLLKPVLTEWADDAALPLYLVYPGHRQQSVMIKALCGFLKMTLPQGAGLQARPRKEQRSRLPLIARDSIRVVDAHV